MTNGHVTSTSDYLSSTRSVLEAGKRLQSVLDEDPATRDFAIARLERAAQLHDDGGSSFRAFMFSELESGAGTRSVVQERVADDVTDLGKIEAMPRLEGRQMVMMINPVKH